MKKIIFSTVVIFLIFCAMSSKAQAYSDTVEIVYDTLFVSYETNRGHLEFNLYPVNEKTYILGTDSSYISGQYLSSRILSLGHPLYMRNPTIDLHLPEEVKDLRIDGIEEEALPIFNKIKVFISTNIGRFVSEYDLNTNVAEFIHRITYRE